MIGEISEFFQRAGDVDAVRADRLRHAERNRSEIEHAFDSGCDHHVGNRLRLSRGNRDDSDVDVKLLDFRFEILGVIAAAAGDDAVDFAFIRIERRDDGQPRVAVSEIRENGASEVSDSHQGNGTVFRAVEYDGDAGDEAGDIIPFVSRVAEDEAE